MDKSITFGSHYVTYAVIKNNKTIEVRKDDACFGTLFRLQFDPEFEIELSDFLRNQTSVYAAEYIKLISNICNVTTIFISENKIKVSGFKNKFLLKMFLTLYRLLFESNAGYGCILSDVIKRRIKFFEALLNKSVACEYRCNLKKLVHFHNLYIGNSLGNTNHCLRASDSIKLKIKSKTELLTYKTGESVHSFFM